MTEQMQPTTTAPQPKITIAYDGVEITSEQYHKLLHGIIRAFSDITEPENITITGLKVDGIKTTAK